MQVFIGVTASSVLSLIFSIKCEPVKLLYATHYMSFGLYHEDHMPNRKKRTTINAEMPIFVYKNQALHSINLGMEICCLLELLVLCDSADDGFHEHFTGEAFSLSMVALSSF